MIVIASSLSSVSCRYWGSVQLEWWCIFRWFFFVGVEQSLQAAHCLCPAGIGDKDNRNCDAVLDNLNPYKKKWSKTTASSCVSFRYWGSIQLEWWCSFRFLLYSYRGCIVIVIANRSSSFCVSCRYWESVQLEWWCGFRFILYSYRACIVIASRSLTVSCRYLGIRTASMVIQFKKILIGVV